MDITLGKTFLIQRAVDGPGIAQGLAEVLLDSVQGGASVGFMNPFSQEKAVAFWQKALASAERVERIVLVAKDKVLSTIIGTVQVVVCLPENQPHRAEIVKMQVHRSARRLGVGKALIRAAESAALEAGKTLLVLDTVTGSDAERLYVRLGWQRYGVIPNYALWPNGGLCSTTLLYRQLEND